MTASPSVSLNGVGVSSRRPWRRAQRWPARSAADRVANVWPTRAIVWVNTSRYSGYIASDPLFNAWRTTVGGPMLSLMFT